MSILLSARCQEHIGRDTDSLYTSHMYTAWVASIMASMANHYSTLTGIKKVHLSVMVGAFPKCKCLQHVFCSKKSQQFCFLHFSSLQEGFKHITKNRQGRYSGRFQFEKSGKSGSGLILKPRFSTPLVTHYIADGVSSYVVQGLILFEEGQHF